MYLFLNSVNSEMAVPSLLCFILASASLFSPSLTDPTFPDLSTAQELLRKPAGRLFKPLIGDDGKIYTCSDRSLFAFENNGTISWTVPLGFKCNVRTAPVRSDSGKIYLIAENRVLKINPLLIATSKSAVEVFFGPEPGQEAPDEIIGVSVSTLSSAVFINVKQRGLFAYARHGKLIWSVGPVVQQYGYRQGCWRGVKDCYFTSVPVIDQCEISNSEGELYSLSIRSPHFKWIQDFSSFDKAFTFTAGNNGRLFVTLPVKAVLLALDVSSGNVLWQRSIGPLSTADYAPVVDSNGWISVGSLDGFVYSFSPDGMVKKYKKLSNLDSVFQVSPLLDCSGYAIYVSQTKMEGKISRTIGEYTYVSAMRPVTVVFMLLVPATGSIYWSETYPGQVSSLLSESDLQHFVLDEEILLAFLAASKTGNPLRCRTTGQKLSSSCSKTRSKQLSIYTGNERAILLFLLFETAVLIVLAGVVRFCCIFWRKRKIQGQGLGNFLEKRHSLWLRKKAFDRTIAEVEQRAAEEPEAGSVVEDLVREREGIERKLSTTYSLGRDNVGGSVSVSSKSLLPIFDWKPKSYSFGTNKRSVSLFHTLSDTTSRESSSEAETSWSDDNDDDLSSFGRQVSSVAASSSRGYVDTLVLEKMQDHHQEVAHPMLKRRTLSSIN